MPGKLRKDVVLDPQPPRSSFWMTEPAAPRQRTCVVIGGGLAGLSAADTAVAAGWRTILIDAAGRAGGVLDTVRYDGWLVERSADSFLSARPEAIDVVRRLGLEEELVGIAPQARRAIVLGRGQLHAVPAGFRLMAPGRLTSVLSSPLLSIPGRLRVLAERFIQPGPGRDESLEHFAVRRLGREAFERLVQPLVSGIWTADPSRLSMAAACPDFLAMEQEHGSLQAGERKRIAASSPLPSRDAGISGARYGQFVTLASGIDTLPTCWAAALAARGVTLSQGRVAALERATRLRLTIDDDSATAGHGPNWSPSERQLDADAVVVAVAAPLAARLVASLSPALHAELAAIDYAGSAIVCLGFPRDAVAHPLDAAGLVIPRCEKREILAVSFSSSKFPGRAPAGHVLLRVFIGGALDPVAATLDDETLQARACREVRSLLGIRGEPSFTLVARWEGAMPQYHLGHVERVARIAGIVAEQPGLALAGAAYEGVGIPQVIASGRTAATTAMATSSSCRPSQQPAFPLSPSSS